jgi:hypothetical protein
MSNTYHVSSVTQRGKYEPFELQVSRNDIANHVSLSIFGFGSTTATPTAGVFYPAWENANTPSYYVYPNAPMQMYLASTVSGDAGALIQISGLDGNYNPISELLALGATAGTGVVTAKTYWRINSISVSFSSTINPTGVITLQNQAATSGSIEYAQINTSTLNGSTVNNGTSQMSVYTVPANSTLYLSRFTANTSYTGNTANYTLYRAVAQYPSALNSSATLIKRVVLQTPFVTEYNIQRTYPFAYPAGTDIQWQFAPSGTVAVSVGINVGGVLIFDTVA